MTMTVKKEYSEKSLSPWHGAPMLVLVIVLGLLATGGCVYFGVRLDALERSGYNNTLALVVAIVVFVLSLLYLCAGLPILCIGFKVINPNEALVLLYFGKYYGTISKEGFFWVNPFCVGFNPAATSYLTRLLRTNTVNIGTKSDNKPQETNEFTGKKLSLKAITHDNEKQKINDSDGNPIEIGVVLIWRIINTAKAVFNVDNFKSFVSTQVDAATRHVVRQFPYDVSNDGDEKSLRGSAQEVSELLRSDLQERVEIAGIEIVEARISHLAYAPEIAAAMLQRQQASAIVAARQKIVEGAVGMVEMALDKLKDNNIVNLDDERKAAMVSNLLVVLCGNRDAQPVVNSGSLY